MTNKDELKNKLRQKSKESIARTDMLLATELDALMKANHADLESLRPKITDQDTYDQLIAVVNEATQKNMDIAMLKERIESLGSKAIGVGKQVAELLKFL